MVYIDKRYLMIGTIVILLILDIAIFINGINLSPDKCEVKFNSQMAADKWVNNNGKNYSIKITELNSNLNNGKCLISWSDTEGYRYSP